MQTKNIVAAALAAVALVPTADLAYGVATGVPMNSLGMIGNLFTILLLSIFPGFQLGKGGISMAKKALSNLKQSSPDTPDLDVDLDEIDPSLPPEEVTLREDIESIIQLSRRTDISAAHKEVLGEILKSIVIGKLDADGEGIHAHL